MEPQYLKAFEEKVEKCYDETTKQLRRTSSMPSVKCIHTDER
jgi:hypothetical protein